MRADANKIALHVVRSILDAAKPGSLKVNGTNVTWSVSRGPEETWPSQELPGLAQSDGPWPRSVEVACLWEGGRCVIKVVCRAAPMAKYKGQVSITARLGDFGRHLMWLTVPPAIGDNEDGSPVRLRVAISTFQRKADAVADLGDRLNQALGEALQASGLPMMSSSSAELCQFDLPSGEIAGGPDQAFARLVHVALLKLDFVDRGAEAKSRGKPLFDLLEWGIDPWTTIPTVDEGDEADDAPSEGENAEAVPRGRRYWGGALLHMLRVAAGVELRSYSPASQETGNTTLLELVVARFLDEVERLQHQGLSKGYRETQQNSSAFRGRLVAQENLRTNLVRPDRFYVRFCTYDVDILINRIISKALEVAASLALSSSSAARVAACRLAFPEVSGVQATQETFERLRLHRGTVRYASSLHTARLILTRNSPRLRSGKVPVFALLFNMNTLWERYMGVMFRKAAGRDFQVSTQESRGFWKQGAKRARTIRPDIVVRDGSHVVLVADAKWKVPVEGAPADADLKQMFAYNELFTSARAVLVYPAADGRGGYAGGFVGRPHVCETLHVGGATETEPAWSAQVVQAQIRRTIEQAEA